MRKFTKTMAAVLSLTMTLTMVTPVFAEGETNITPAQTTEVVTPTPTPAQPPKNGLFVNEGKTYCYKNGKLVKNKYGYKVKKKYYRIDKKGVATLVSTDKCGGDLKKAFKWSSTKIKYWGSVGKPKKGQNQVEYYATYGFKNGKGDCYVMAATFCMMAKVKGYKNVKMVKGTVPQANGKNGAHGWCEIKIGKTVYAYDPNFAYTYRNNPNVNSGYKFKYGAKGTYKYNEKRTKISF